MSEKEYKSRDDIIYSISVGDVQLVAEQKIYRELSDSELQKVDEKLGDFVDWYEAINLTISEVRGES